MSFTPSYDETREPLEVFAIDDNMNRATGSIPYRSLRWVRRYCEPGEFEMVVPANVYSPNWAYIYADKRPEMGIVQKVEYQDDAQAYGGIDSVTLSGYFFEAVLNNIVFLVESPEEQKVYVPEPRRPWFQHSKQDAKVYTDGVGGYYYENAQGTITNAETGTSGLTTDGLTEVDYYAAYGAMLTNPDIGLTTKDYFYTADHQSITVVPYLGDEHGQPTETYDIVFEDDKGNVFYRNEYNGLTQAVGVVDSYGSTYQARKKSWNALDGDDYGKYYTVTVMMGNWILYEEPTIEGVQKAVDPSFQYLGDLLYSTLYEVGASLRLEYLFEKNIFYLFEKNIFILSTYRGYDRTQLEDTEPVAATMLPEVDALAEVAPLSDDSVLSSGYTELEYIQSSGTQYINTGFNPDNNTRLVVDFETLTAQTDKHFFGSRISMGGTSFCFADTAQGTFRDDYARSQYTFPSSTSEVGRYTLDKNKNFTSFAGSSHSHSYNSFSIPYPIYLCALNTGGSTTTFSSMRIYSCQIYDNGAKVREMVPAKRDSDGAIGLYDTVGGTFYGNAGTGAFAAGPEVKYPAKLTYYPNSTTATGEVAAQDGYVGDSVIVAQNGYADPNKTFLSWGTSPSGGTTYQPGNRFVLTGMTDALYAQWQQNEPQPPGPVPTGDSAPWAVFSDTWGTISGYDATQDESNYKNTCYVLYDYDVPNEFDENGWPKAGPITMPGDLLAFPSRYGIKYTSKRGYNTERIGGEDEPAIETYLDLRDEKPSCDSDWSRDWVDLPTTDSETNLEAQQEAAEQFAPPDDAYDMQAVYEAYEAALPGRGETYLRENYGVETTLDTGTVNTRDYLKGWDLGDLVEFEVSTLGLAEQARITEVEENYESGKVSISITVGDSQLIRTKTGGA